MSIFYGKIDKSNVKMSLEGSDKIFMGVRKEEHISMCMEPGDEYLHHFTPGESSKEIPPAKVIALGMFDYLKSVKQDMNLDAVGGDSTNVNTGYKGGSIHFLECLLGRRLLWIICYLHCNELPLRHLIINLDGPTRSDNTFSGPLGKSLQNVEDLDYNPRFKSINLGPGLPELSQEAMSGLGELFGNICYCVIVNIINNSCCLY